MDAGSGARRNPARYLALLALAAVVAALYLVVHHYTGPTASTQGAASVQTSSATTKPKADRTTVAAHPAPSSPEFYIVRPGDSLSVIASRSGVTLGALEALNPGLRADQIQPGQHLRLRR